MHHHCALVSGLDCLRATRNHFIVISGDCVLESLRILDFPQGIDKVGNVADAVIESLASVYGAVPRMSVSHLDVERLRVGHSRRGKGCAGSPAKVTRPLWLSQGIVTQSAMSSNLRCTLWYPENCRLEWIGQRFRFAPRQLQTVSVSHGGIAMSDPAGDDLKSPGLWFVRIGHVLDCADCQYCAAWRKDSLTGDEAHDVV